DHAAVHFFAIDENPMINDRGTKIVAESNGNVTSLDLLPRILCGHLRGEHIEATLRSEVRARRLRDDVLADVDVARTSNPTLRNEVATVVACLPSADRKRDRTLLASRVRSLDFSLRLNRELTLHRVVRIALNANCELLRFGGFWRRLI